MINSILYLIFTNIFYKTLIMEDVDLAEYDDNEDFPMQLEGD